MNVIAMLMLAADPMSQPLPDVVLLDFTATYCPPCQQMVPVLQRMEKDRYPIRKIDISEHPDLSRQYRVDRIPTFILMVEGKEVKRFVGLTADEELRRAMNDAARKLETARKASEPDQAPESDSESGAETFEDFADRQPADAPEQPVKEESPGMIRGLIDRVKRGVTGDEPKLSRSDLEHPDFRAQSPDTEEPEADPRIPNDSMPVRATVRVRLDDGEFKDVGTGTIVHSTNGQSTVLTCAHMFKKVGKSAKVEVETFFNGEVLVYEAEVIGGNHDSDLAFLRIRNRDPLPMVPLCSGDLKIDAGESVFSMGCNAGNTPTMLSMKVLKVNFFNGPENIVCSIDPVQGRSGGGLFNQNGELIGVCSGAFRKTKEGLYSGVGAVRELVTSLELTDLFEKEAAPAFVSAPPEQEDANARNPFSTDDDLFEQMFADTEPVFTEEVEPKVQPKAEPAITESAVAPEPAPVFAEAPRAKLASSRSLTAVPEVTVIIDDPVKGKQVVVIPRPSPWLLKMLTGQNAASSGVDATMTSHVSASRTRTAMAP